jgi:histidinol phosphatase-like enzyme (inositol monophosphatase family)
MPSRIEKALEIVRQAGEIAREGFARPKRFERKADQSPVTETDRAIEAFIVGELRKDDPGVSVLGEETGTTGTTDRRWVIDPIDGTKSFLAGVPLYATLLSYEEGGETLLGICALPSLNEVVWAEKGKGAFWNGEPCQVSRATRLEDAVISVGGLQSMHKYHRLDPVVRELSAALAIRGWSDAYGHALVATGRIEAMIDPIVSLWDIHALDLILREAGGYFCDFRGEPHPRDEALSIVPGLRDVVLGAFR